jgi:pyrimidine precursor biosynthesis enzyme
MLLFPSPRHRPYHAPVFLAQSKGYFAEQGIQVALITPQDPSDVTEIIGSGKVKQNGRVSEPS